MLVLLLLPLLLLLLLLLLLILRVQYFSASKNVWTKAKVKKIHSKTIDLGRIHIWIPAVNSLRKLCC